MSNWRMAEVTARWNGAQGGARALVERKSRAKAQAKPASQAVKPLLWLGMITFILAAFWLSTVQAQARPVPETFADLVEELAPAVVNISTTQKVKRRAGRRRSGPGAPFADDFFRDFFERMPMQPQTREVQSLGSGFVVDPRGFIVTNNHVVGEATDIQVNFDSGLTLPAKLVGKDEATDLAVIKVEHDKPLPTVKFGDSDLARVGDWVLAIGNPFNFGRSVTAGIVSGRNRRISSSAFDDFIQTDAAINRGNSGGPLFDRDGSVIGVNTVIISPTGGSVGIGFAISSNLAQGVVNQLIEYGETRRGWLGVRIQSLSEELASGFGLSEAKGALVAGVQEDSPAASAGVKVGDVILEFDGKEIGDNRDLVRMVSGTKIGKRVNIAVWRDGKKRTLKVKLGKLDADLVADMRELGSEGGDARGERDLDDLGITVAPVTDPRAERFNLDPDVKGVLVVNVDPQGPAARDLVPGDVIVEVDHNAVQQPKDLASKIKSKLTKSDDPILFYVRRRDGNLSFVAVDVEEQDEE